MHPQYLILSYCPGIPNWVTANFRELFENPWGFSKLLPSFSPRILRIFENNPRKTLEPRCCSHSRKFSKFENKNENFRERGLVWHPYIQPSTYVMTNLMKLLWNIPSHITYDVEKNKCVGQNLVYGIISLWLIHKRAAPKGKFLFCIKMKTYSSFIWHVKMFRSPEPHCYFFKKNPHRLEKDVEIYLVSE